MKSLIYWQPENFVDNKKFNQEEFNEILKTATKQRLDVDVRSGFCFLEVWIQQLLLNLLMILVKRLKLFASV